MKHVLIFLSLITCCLSSCSSLVRPVNPFTHFDQVFIPDERPLTPANSSNLQDIAISLPIWETGDPHEWLIDGSGAIQNKDHWILVADGAQQPVEIYRLPLSEAGKTRVRVVQGPLFNGFGSDPYKWFFDLERTNGGWTVIASEIVLAEQDAAPNRLHG